MKQTMFNRKIFIDTFTYLCLTPKDTGLNCSIWLDSLGCERRHSKHPYILIEHKKVWEKIYMNKIPKGISYELYLWCENNKDVVERHWNKELSDATASTIFGIKMHIKEL